MSFRKAIQRMAKPEGYEEYLQALIMYKKACSLHKKTMLRLKDRHDPASRLAKADSSAMYKQTCKAYYAAQTKYAQLIAFSKMKEKGIDTSAIDVAKAVGVEFPLSLKEMLEEERRSRAPVGMTEEEFNSISKAALAYMNRGTEEDSFHRTKNLFFADKKAIDPLENDFEPLPDDTIKEGE